MAARFLADRKLNIQSMDSRVYSNAHTHTGPRTPPTGGLAAAAGPASPAAGPQQSMQPIQPTMQHPSGAPAGAPAGASAGAPAGGKRAARLHTSATETGVSRGVDDRAEGDL